MIDIGPSGRWFEFCLWRKRSFLLYQCVCFLYIYRFVFLSACLSVRLSACLPACLSACVSCCLSVTTRRVERWYLVWLLGGVKSAFCRWWSLESGEEWRWVQYRSASCMAGMFSPECLEIDTVRIRPLLAPRFWRSRCHICVEKVQPIFSILQSRIVRTITLDRKNRLHVLLLARTTPQPVSCHCHP